MTVLEFLSELPYATGVVVYVLLAFYFTYAIAAWAVEAPFRVWDWLNGSK